MLHIMTALYYAVFRLDFILLSVYNDTLNASCIGKKSDIVREDEAKQYIRFWYLLVLTQSQPVYSATICICFSKIYADKFHVHLFFCIFYAMVICRKDG